MAQYEVKIFFKILFTVPLVIAVVFLVFSYFLSLPLGLVLFFFTPPGSDVSRLYLSRLHLPQLINPDFYIPSTINAGLVFLFLLGVYTLCFAAAWMTRESFHSVIKKGLSRPVRQLFNNNLFAMPTIASMLFITFIIIHVILDVPTGPGPFEPSEDPLQPFKDFFAVTYSPLVEEIGFRVIPIGIFLIAYLFVVGIERLATFSGGGLLKILFLIPFYPDKAKELLGVRTVREFGIRGISLPEWIVIVFTSVVFGLVHIGGGWETGKSISTFIDGLAFGLVYLLYGVQAPILLHWFFNYYISGYGAYGLALDFYPTISPIFLLIFLGTLILGVLGWTMFTALLGAWLYRRRKRAVPPQPLRLLPAKPLQPITRSCLRCGQLLSEDAKFCPYCGKSIEEEKEES